jgi:hypothetical protein
MYVFVADDYSTLAKSVRNGEGIYHGPEYEIADYLGQQNVKQQTIFLLDDIIVYWFLGNYPPTRLAAHPSNINKPFLVTAVEGPDATCEGEMLRILSKNPGFIVKSKDVRYLNPSDEATRVLNDALNADYVLINNIRGREIYRRIESAD